MWCSALTGQVIAQRPLGLKLIAVVSVKHGHVIAIIYSICTTDWPPHCLAAQRATWNLGCVLILSP